VLLLLLRIYSELLAFNESEWVRRYEWFSIIIRGRKKSISKREKEGRPE
jgi:hypothetical protein